MRNCHAILRRSHCKTRKNYWSYSSIVMEHAMSHSDSDLSLKHVRAQIRRLRSAFNAPTLARFLGISHAHHCRQPSGRASFRVVPRPVEGKVSARLRISVNPSLTPRQCPVGGSPQAAAAAAWSLVSHPAGWGLPRVPGGVLTTHCEVRDFMVTCGQRSGLLGLNLEAVSWEPGTEPKAGK